jgi:hypothetical protein
MRIAKWIFLSAALFVLASCSSAKIEVANTSQENVNANAQSVSNSTDTQTDLASGGQAQPAVAPEATVKDLYKTHDKDNGAILNGKSRTLLDKYFDKNLANLIWKDMTTHKDEVGVLDFDPFYNTQDPDIKNLSVGQAKTEGAKATVPVSFTNSGRKETITYALVQQNSAWKISDIKYEGGGSLLKYFKEDAQNNAAQKKTENGNFEGTYQVGDVTCTVKPVKMAFELKWAKGSGTIIFYYTGEGVLEYSSEETGDKFVFDDDTFTTGKFIRGSDGKEMRVKKM